MTAPTLIVTQSFSEAAAALDHASTIYNSGIAHLRQSMAAFVAGQTPTQRIRANYPFVRVRTNTVARADSRLDRKSTRLNSSHGKLSRMPSSA